MSFRIKPTNKYVNQRPQETNVKLDINNYGLYSYGENTPRQTSVNSFDMPSPKYIKGPVVRSTNQSNEDFY